MSSAFMDKIAAKNIPVHFICELTYRCNHKCAHCYQKDSDCGELGLEQWKYVIDQLKEANILSLTFTGGEPLLHKNFWEICEYARDSGFALAFMTNGTLIGEKEAERMAGWPVWEVQLSLYGATAETHDRMSGVPGSFEKVTAACERLRARGLNAQYVTALTTVNSHELEDIHAMMKTRGMKPFISPLVFPNRRGDSLAELRLGDDQMSCAFEYLGLDKYLSETAAGRREAGDGLCHTAKTSGVINPAGDVLPCVVLPIKAGNIFETPLTEIWMKSPALVRMRNTTKADIEQCAVCGISDTCIKCMGVGYMETGRYPAVSGELCRIANLLQRSRLNESKCEENLLKAVN